MAVAQMVCEDTPVSYFDYENTTTPRMADTMDCTVDKKVVCEPVTTKKCAEVTYTRCEEVRIVYIYHTPHEFKLFRVNHKVILGSSGTYLDTQEQN